MDEAVRIKACVRMELRKFDGDIEPGKEPVEVIVSEEDVELTPQQLKEMTNGHD